MRGGKRAWAAAAAALAGFLLVTVRLNPTAGDVSIRVPEQERLARLIRVEQRRSADLRATAETLRKRVRQFERAQPSGAPELEQGLTKTRIQLGLVAVEGPGLTVTLDDSSLEESPSGNLNDLVVHSGDIQAVANALWAAGAEALAVSGQRVVPTSALLCVGNTLLINGTVHSPPYRFVAVGEGLKDGLLADPLVERLRHDADRFGLGFEVNESDKLRVPAYRGTTAVRYARAG
ncbi:MAG: DUF881 domain-containing protein [Actinomycetota bacterium]|nr:DUF881 domain-containing protein [Actinomycetota bacterium]